MSKDRRTCCYYWRRRRSCCRRGGYRHAPAPMSALSAPASASGLLGLLAAACMGVLLFLTPAAASRRGPMPPRTTAAGRENIPSPRTGAICRHAAWPGMSDMPPSPRGGRVRRECPYCREVASASARPEPGARYEWRRVRSRRMQSKDGLVGVCRQSGRPLTSDGI